MTYNINSKLSILKLKYNKCKNSLQNNRKFIIIKYLKFNKALGIKIKLIIYIMQLNNKIVKIIIIKIILVIIVIIVINLIKIKIFKTIIVIRVILIYIKENLIKII